MVSPGNPLKAASGMAPFAARFASARIGARQSRIRAVDIEARLGTRYTVDSVRVLIRRYPRRRFVWIMGADLVGEFHRWRDWRRLAALLPFAIVVRPGYMGVADASVAAVWFRRFVRPLPVARDWTRWRPPAIVLLHSRPDPSSATAIRGADPDWFRHLPVRATPHA